MGGRQRTLDSGSPWRRCCGPGAAGYRGHPLEKFHSACADSRGRCDHGCNPTLSVRLWGQMTRDDRKQKTGFLTVKAAANALVVTSVLQRALGRERPAANDLRGRFPLGGTAFPWPLLHGEKISFRPMPNLEFGFTRTTELDCRPEAFYTDPPTPHSYAGGFQGWTTYWFSPWTWLQVGHRHTYVASDFIPHGETLNDGSAKVIGGWASSLACRPLFSTKNSWPPYSLRAPRTT